MKTLLISENKADWDIISNILKVHYNNVELVCAINAQAAMDAASSTGPFGFFLLDCNLREADPNELALELLDLTGDRPIIFFGHETVIKDRISQDLFNKNECNDTIYKPLDRNDILEEVKSKVNRALAWAQEEEYEQSLEEVNPDDFISMKLRAFFLYGMFPYDIYLAVTKQNYIKIISANKFYSHSTLSAYAKKGIKYLYIKKNDQLKYLESETSKCLVAHAKIDIKSPDVYLLQLRSITIMHQYLLALGVNEGLNNLMDATINSISQKAQSKVFLYSIFEDYPKLYEGSSSKSLLTAYIAEALAKKLGWDSETTKSKLIASAILQDATLTEDSMSKINTISHFEKHDYSEEEKDIYVNHPTACANFAKLFTNYPDIDFIIENHHELSERKGFPNRPSGSRFTQITAVFNTAQYVAGEIDGQKLDNTLFSLIHKSITKDYTGAIFREIQKHLKTVLKIP